MAENDDKPEGGEVISIEEARKKKEGEPAAAPVAENSPLQPIMAAIARELQNSAGPGGKLEGMSEEEQAKVKAEALLRGLGVGLGDALAQALSKFAGKLDVKLTVTPPDVTPKAPSSETPPPPEDPTKKS